MHTEFIFDHAPFAACHAATIVDTSCGLITAWFGGEDEGSPDTGIWMSRRDSKCWSRVVEIANGLEADGRRYACWNPVFFATDETLLLFYKVGDNPRSWWGMMTTSTDGGLTWSRPQRLPDGILGPIKNKPIQLSNGNLLCASSVEQDGWTVHIEITSDLGQTWVKTNPLNHGVTLAAIQPTVLNYPCGELQILCRTRQSYIAQSWSRDYGQSWSKMELIELPNPDSGIDGVVLKDGRALLVYNHSKTRRSPLNIAASADGKSWSPTLILEDRGGEYSYPAVIQSSDGLLHVVYTWKRRLIKHAVIDPTEIRL